MHIIRHFFSTEAHFYRLISIPVVLGQHYHGRVFNARRMFRFGILCVRSMVRIRRLKLTPESLSISVARRDPYRMKAVRKVRVVPFASPPPPQKKINRSTKGEKLENDRDAFEDITITTNQVISVETGYDD